MSDVQELDPNTPWSPDEGVVPDLTNEQLLEIQQGLPLLKEVIEWFEEQIADALNPNIIGGATPTTDAEKLKEQVLFAQRESKRYSKKRNEFAERFKKYTDMMKPQE